MQFGHRRMNSVTLFQYILTALNITLTLAHKLHSVCNENPELLIQHSDMHLSPQTQRLCKQIFVSKKNTILRLTGISGSGPARCVNAGIDASSNSFQGPKTESWGQIYWGWEETKCDQSETHVTDLHGEMHVENVLISSTLIWHLRTDSSLGILLFGPSGNPDVIFSLASFLHTFRLPLSSCFLCQSKANCYLNIKMCLWVPYDALVWDVMIS